MKNSTRLSKIDGDFELIAKFTYNGDDSVTFERTGEERSFWDDGTDSEELSVADARAKYKQLVKLGYSKV